MSKKRIDELLVKQGFAEDKKEALALLMSGVVLVNEQRLEKPGILVESTAAIRLRAETPRFVSRGGLKLQAALEAFNLDVSETNCIDLGASTGGFTDCLLKKGATQVHAFDVGRGQLDWSLQQDPRVVVHDSFNVRNLRASHIGERIDLITADLSFISLKAIFPSLRQFPQAKYLLLVKPQFEARQNEVETGGIIRDSEKRSEILDRVKRSLEPEGFRILDEMECPVHGQKGNIEYFLLLELEKPSS